MDAPSSNSFMTILGMSIAFVILLFPIIYLFMKMRGMEANKYTPSVQVIADNIPGEIRNGTSQNTVELTTNKSWVVPQTPTLMSGKYLVFISAGGFASSAGDGTWTVAVSPDGTTYTNIYSFGQYFNDNNLETHDVVSATFVWDIKIPVTVASWKVTFSKRSNNLDKLTLILFKL